MSPASSEDQDSEVSKKRVSKDRQSKSKLRPKASTAKSESIGRYSKHVGQNISLERGLEGQTNSDASRFGNQSADGRHPVDSDNDGTIKEMLGMGFERPMIDRALQAAYNHPERAVVYLINGIPKEPERKALTSRVRRESHMSAAPVSEISGATSSALGSSSEMRKTSQISMGYPQDYTQSTEWNNSSDDHAAGYSSLTSLTDEFTCKTTKAPMRENTGSTNTTSEFRSTSPQVANPFGEKKTMTSQNRSILSSRQVELELEKIFQPKGDNQAIEISDAEFDRITELLSQADREEWSFRPRTYAILRMINAVDSMNGFVKANCLDIALPYSKRNLPQCLQPDLRARFLEVQDSVLTKAAKIEGSSSSHANFKENADNHLEPLDKLGDGGSGTVDRVRSKLSRKIYARKWLDVKGSRLR